MDPPGVAWWSSVIGGFAIAGLATSILPLVGVVVFIAAAVVTSLLPRVRAFPGRQALLLACVGNAFIFGHSLWLFGLPAGLTVRPMGWNFDVVVVGAGCWLSVLLLGIRSLRKERRIALPGIALVVATEALFLGWQVLTIAASVRGFRIAQD